MFFLFTLLSLPAYVLFWSGMTPDNPLFFRNQERKSFKAYFEQFTDKNFAKYETWADKISYQNYITAFSLANIGQTLKSSYKVDLCLNAIEKLSTVSAVELYCFPQKIAGIRKYHIIKIINEKIVGSCELEILDHTKSFFNQICKS